MAFYERPEMLETAKNLCDAYAAKAADDEGLIPDEVGDALDAVIDAINVLDQAITAERNERTEVPA